jgi:putative endonuclease
MRSKIFAVYLLTNKNKTVLYTGVTNDLRRRVSEHKLKFIPGFTKQYNVDKLVYFEWFEDGPNAIAREKQIKAGSRAKKIALIEASNPEWRDLFELLLE